MSIEVLDGEFPAHLWVEAHGDSLVEAALQCGVIEWRWQHFDWGVVLEIDFAEESCWERFQVAPPRRRPSMPCPTASRGC